MTHRFPLKEIALQAGLGTATIDRVINNRAHVSPQTKARVAAAISELETQEVQLAARGRRMFFDFVIEAPSRFSREVKGAADHVAAQIRTAVCRPRFLLQEVMSETEVVAGLMRIANRGSSGVCLKARDLPAIRAAVDHLVEAGVPVVTLVTDIIETQRMTYVGLDNESAGRTAAYLIAKSVSNANGTVLAIRSNDRFLGEEERETSFLKAMNDRCPDLNIVSVSGGSGVHSETSRVLSQFVDQLAQIRAVYSMGGGNRTILDILQQNRLNPEIYVAHDLDHDNRALIETGNIHYVLHHDLKADIHNVFHAFLHHHRLLTEMPSTTISNIHVVTTENIPAIVH